MSRPSERIEPMLDALRRAWGRHPDQRLGQIVGNAGRVPRDVGPGTYRDPFNVEDDEMWAGLKRLAGPEGQEPR